MGDTMKVKAQGWYKLKENSRYSFYYFKNDHFYRDRTLKNKIDLGSVANLIERGVAIYPCGDLLLPNDEDYITTIVPDDLSSWLKSRYYVTVAFERYMSQNYYSAEVRKIGLNSLEEIYLQKESWLQEGYGEEEILKISIAIAKDYNTREGNIFEGSYTKTMQGVSFEDYLTYDELAVMEVAIKDQIIDVRFTKENNE